jgi:hypothetical protein
MLRPQLRDVNSTAFLSELTQALPALSSSRACPSMSPHPFSAPFTSVLLRTNFQRLSGDGALMTYALKNASRSALMTAACVVGMPCG